MTSKSHTTHLLIPGRRRRSRQPAETKELPPGLALLRQWQSARLANTHHDLLQHKTYGPACQFFLTDIYAPKDFSDRDEDILHVYQAMKRIMPAPIMRTLNLVITLNELTTRLDNDLIRVMETQLDLTDSITTGMYAEAYRLCDNYPDRLRQIELIGAVGRSVHKLVRLPFVGLTLRLAHAPAHFSGWAELQSFLERGFSVFKRMKNAEPFLQLIMQREKTILDQIFTGCAEPMSLPDTKG